MRPIVVAITAVPGDELTDPDDNEASARPLFHSQPSNGVPMGEPGLHELS